MSFQVRLAETLFPGEPGIYRFYSAENELIYVGKAKNLRRRLAQYANAKRRKAHAKMKKILKDAHRVEFEVCANEFEALGLETRWIQKHRPKWNVVGAFYFLYPLLGLRIHEGHLYLCYTTSPSQFPKFSFHGAYRSRRKTKDAYFALLELLTLIGHRMSKPQLRKEQMETPSNKIGYVSGFRQVPAEWMAQLENFLNGTSFSAIEELSVLLLDRPAATLNSSETQGQLREMRKFWRHEIQALKRACLHSKWKEYPVAQKDRDLIFIALKSKGEFNFDEREECIIIEDLRTKATA
jgi:excinuclease UvrABC nuclease subunit